eukprot:TRINITY_DN21578_c0_g1_i1.p1 TRINITY_DN21578_c0_g1~~TRINITY_DN21578_c0_g1_i1.p1  ORF type:complete len:185 (+),score=26.89 TRINITY_DN21578_c0_g1_i1:167-721(+)
MDASRGGSLAIVRYKAKGRRGFSEPGECAICFESFRALEEAAKLPCSESTACQSIFHPRCLHDWLAREGSCPLCRRTFSWLGPRKQPSTITNASFSLVSGSSYVPGSSDPLDDVTTDMLNSWLRNYAREETWLQRIDRELRSTLEGGADDEYAMELLQGSGEASRARRPICSISRPRIDARAHS